MSNLLQRLAAQATGTAEHRVRALPGTPVFAPVGMSREGLPAPTFEPMLRAELSVPRDVGEDAEVAKRSPSLAADVAPLMPAEPETQRIELGRHHEPTGSSASASPRIEPLLPSAMHDVQPASPSYTLRPPARREALPAAARDAEPTEVHVHIGRIEITAEKAAAPAAAKAPTARPSTTLADYLAKRQRRAP